MFYDDIITKLQNLQKTAGSNYGTSRCRALLNALGSPDDGLKIIHVAATNGKGSICEYITRILVADGKRVGTFTSPAAFCYEEQFRLDGENAETQKLKRCLSLAYTAAQALEDVPSAFEIETAAALYLFYSEGCEYAVLECGMGGLNDATNAVDGKLVAVIGSVSLEHTAFLGNTIEQICRQKAGIIRGCPAVITCLQSEEGLRCLSEYAPSFSGEGLHIAESAAFGQRFIYGGESYEITMRGREQCYNAALAIDCCRMLGVGVYAIREGLLNARLAGRVQEIKKDGKIYVLDGAHNAAAYSPLLQYLNAQNCDKSIIFGCLSDKDVNAALKILSGGAQKIIVVQPDSYRAMDGDKIYEEALKYFPEAARAQSVSGALEQSKSKLTAVCGSFTLLAEAKRWIEKGQ